ncbi:MAG: EAL domain-containing protein [Sulfurimonas sp.]|nr:EAL domain-containing protein [Sulfurimonas sp.]
MSIEKQTKRNTLILTSLVLVVCGVVIYVFLKVQLKNSVNEQFEALSKSTESLYSLNLENQTKKFDTELDTIISADGLSEAVAKGNYEQIKSIVTPYYKHIKETNSGVDILTFRSYEGVTLFRAHKPEEYGDKINEKRKLITDTDRLQTSLNGFEVGKYEMTYRITKPLFHNGKYVGNVEIGINPTSFIKDLTKILNIDVGIAIEKSLLNIMLNPTALSLNDKYVLAQGSDNLKSHFGHTPHPNGDGEFFKIDMSILLKNHLSETLGYLVVGFDTSEMLQRDKDFINHLFLILAIMMFLVGNILHQGFEIILKQFKKQIYTDHLTGLKNRYALNDALVSEQSHVLILSNIKEFSLINELYGVDVGNQILIKVAEAFESFALEHELTAYRVAGDEFVVFKEERIFDVEKYNSLVDALHVKINSLKISVEGVDEFIGIELYSGIAFDHAHSLEDAQMALKKAKKQSLPYLMYSQQVDTKEHSQKVMKVKRTIRHAVEHNNIIPFFQPITDRNGKFVKYEALVRIIEFEEGERKVLLPDDFLDVSMKSGLYITIAKSMLKQSLDFFANRDEKISINFLPNDFFNATLMDTLIEGIENFDSPDKIVVEITEQEGVENFERLVRVVKQLRKLGVLIAIDDFGSGYANYAHILGIKPDYIKIDGTLIKNVLTDRDSQILVKSIVDFARELNITTVAEYVENEEIFELLKEYGVDEFQGYHFGCPTDLLNSQDMEMK